MADFLEILPQHGKKRLIGISSIISIQPSLDGESTEFFLIPTEETDSSFVVKKNYVDVISKLDVLKIE